MEEILFAADIVVYGKETERIKYQVEGNEDEKALFSIYCVLKSEKPLNSTITIYNVLYRTSCSGTKVITGKDYILALKEKDDGYEWHEVNVVPDGASFEADAATLAKATRVCGLTNPALPLNSVTGKCPSRFEGECAAGPVGRASSPNTLSVVLVAVVAALMGLVLLC